MIRSIQGKIPIFGICMGHQLYAKANGAKTYKMKFGHRGFNHAVREIVTGRVDFLQAKNHGFAVSREDLPDCLMITHEEINDNRSRVCVINTFQDSRYNFTQMTWSS